MAASNQAQYSGLKLATSTLVVSIFEFIFIATPHKHCGIKEKLVIFT